MIFIFILTAFGLFSAAFFLVYRHLEKKYPPSVDWDVATSMEKAAILLHQIRVMAIANMVVFIVFATLSVVAYSRLGDSNNAFTELNRVTICDLYIKTDLVPPPALHCAGK